MHTVFQVVFWGSLAILLYTYLGYPLAIVLLSRWRPRPTRLRDITPSVTVLIAAYDEEDCIAHKIENTLALDYPPAGIDVLIVTDGSSDRTPDIVTAYPDARVRLLHQPERQGKSAALRRAWPHVTSEVVLFSDANCTLQPVALRAMVRHLADPQVGGVSGAKRFTSADGAVGPGEGLYWRYESFLKRCDSAVGSVMGAPGEVWLARRVAYVPPEPDILLDDFVTSLRMVAAGWRVVYEPQAMAFEQPSPGLYAEWRRRVRNSAGGWQAVFRLREMWRLRPLLVWQYVSHRVARWTLAPLAQVVLLVANMGLLSKSAYAVFAMGQGLLYGLAAMGWLLARSGHRTGLLSRITIPFLYLIMLHMASLAGGIRYLSGRHSVLWRKVR
jgi:cellulose synthase/poly-beta-1,6-N-acetylglucosamine synthase-like glycosyltransferase